MGYIKHDAIIITGWSVDDIFKVHQKAEDIFNKHFNEYNSENFTSGLVSEIIEGIANGQVSFFIAPDGSKEGWGASEIGNFAREEFINWLNTSDIYCDYVEVRFGGDDDYNAITNSNKY